MSSDSGARDTVRLLTMNVYGPGNPDWDRRHRLVGETIRALDPDVVALQEVPVDSPETMARLTFDLANPLVRDGEVATAVSRKIDHILVRSGLHGPTLQVADCRRVLDRPVGGVWASDHYGVVVDLGAPPNRPGFRS